MNKSLARYEKKEMKRDLKEINLDSQNLIKEKEYYVVKKLEDFTYNEEKIQRRYQNYFHRVIERLQNVDLRPKFSNRLVRVTKTGLKVDANDGDFREYEYSNKSSANALYALLKRQLATYTKPDPNEMEQFRDFVRGRIQELFGNYTSGEIEIDDFYTWLDKKNFPKKKKLKYLKTFHKQIVDVNPKFIGSFNTMVKSGEVYRTKNFYVDLDGYVVGVVSRPRNICIPDDDT